MSFTTGLIPIVGPPIEAYDTLRAYNEGEMSFEMATARMAAIGGMFALHNIVAFKHVPQVGGNAFHVATVRRMQMIFYAVPRATVGLGLAIGVAAIHQETRRNIRKDSAAAGSPFSYTTPFSSGFGSVV